MRIRIIKPAQRQQRGQTIVLVALSITFIIAMAALAIDLTTLYVARGEMQRAADGAALAGAKAFVDSGTTTAPDVAGTAGTNNMQRLAADLANAYVTAILTRNEVGSVAPSLVPPGTLGTTCAGNQSCVDFTTHPGNPQITVTLQRTNVPTFFSRLFGRRLATVTATATAEAYNSSLPAGSAAANMPPVAPKCVKPWIVPNADPRHKTGVLPDKFVDAAGHIVHPGVWNGTPNGIIGEQITLINDCKLSTPGSCAPARNPPVAGGDPGHTADGLDYLPVQLLSATGSCTSCAGSTNFEQSSACCDTGNSYSCGAAAPGVLIDLATNIVSDTISSVECLIGATGSGSNRGQDTIDTGNFLASNGRDPVEVRAGSSHKHNGSFVNTSPAIATLPIYDSTASPIPGSGLLGPVKIIGYMQAFVQQANSPDADVVVTILNISGCGPNVNTGLKPISGGGVSPVPVRLIHN